MIPILFLEPVLHEKIWGGQKLATAFDFDLPADKIGEAWCISGHPNGVSKVIGDNMYHGMGLDEVYHQHPDLFGLEEAGTSFPLLVKLLDASDDLSVQVHPDDSYAQIHEGPRERGKTECWYVLDAEPGASIIMGHNAKTPEEFKAMVETEDWQSLLRSVEVKAGDFFYVPHGTIHAIGAGVLILETQQSSDTTYRVFDYHRKDAAGNERELHLTDAINVTLFPHQASSLELSQENRGDSIVTHYVTSPFFTIKQWEVRHHLDLQLDKTYYLATVIDGHGWMEVASDKYNLNKGDSFIIPFGVENISLYGLLNLIVANPE